MKIVDVVDILCAEMKPIELMMNDTAVKFPKWKTKSLNTEQNEQNSKKKNNKQTNIIHSSFSSA